MAHLVRNYAYFIFYQSVWRKLKFANTQKQTISIYITFRKINECVFLSRIARILMKNIILFKFARNFITPTYMHFHLWDLEVFIFRMYFYKYWYWIWKVNTQGEHNYQYKVYSCMSSVLTYFRISLPTLLSEVSDSLRSLLTSIVPEKSIFVW